MRVAGAVLLSVLAAGLLAAGTFFFAFFGYCEDTCDAPDRTFLGALGAGGPFALGAVALLTIAAALVMRRPRLLPAVGLALVSAVVIVGLVVLGAVIAFT